MKKTILFPVILIFSLPIISCSQKNTEKSGQIRQEIIDADLAMSNLAVKEGFYNALIQYADDDFVKLSDGRFPVIGKKEFEELFKNKPGFKTLTWEPVKAEVAQSGELGYTWGNWKLALSDTTVFGNYFTIWKKNTEGKWLMALDGGNSTPAPK